MTALHDDDRPDLLELAPLLRRAVSLDPRALVRLRIAGSPPALSAEEATATAYVRLPFAVLVSRSVRCADRGRTLDVAVPAAETLAWLDAGDHAPGAVPDEAIAPPDARDDQWRTGLPPRAGWTRLETVPDDDIRSIVRAGALTLKQAADREGVPGAQPRAEVSDVLLDSVVLHVQGAHGDAEVTLRALSALTRMGFLPKGGHAYIDSVGRWLRVVAEHGTVYQERPGSGLTLR